MLYLRKVFLTAALACGMAISPGCDEATGRAEPEREYVPTAEESTVFELGFELHRRGFDMARYDGRYAISPEGVQKEYRFRATPIYMPGDTFKVAVRQNDNGGGRRFLFKK